MTDAPIAQTIHPGPGTGPPAGWRAQVIGLWLAAHGINADQVSADHPITVLAVPFQPPEAAGKQPWLIQVIVFWQYFTTADGKREPNMLTGQPVVFQRTVPLHTPFPAGLPTDGADRGEADREEAQQTAEEVVRPAGQEGLSDPRQGPRPGGPVQGGAARDESAAEEGPRRGHEAVPEPEEDRQEAVEGAQ